MATGALIPSNMFFDIMLPYFSKPELANRPLVLSSIGRMKGEEGVIFQATEQGGHPTKAVVYLSMPEEVVWQRYDLAQQADDRGDRRDDGGREVLANRINKFMTQTIPVIDFYREKGLLIEVDGTKDRETVTREIIDALTTRAGTVS